MIDEASTTLMPAETNTPNAMKDFNSKWNYKLHWCNGTGTYLIDEAI